MKGGASRSRLDRRQLTPGSERRGQVAEVTSPPASYYDTSGWDPRDMVSGGSRMIPVTPVGEFRVWTKRVGTNPDLKVLFLHGEPGASGELYECFDSWFPREGIEYYYY